jgi:hypothetical protein
MEDMHVHVHATLYPQFIRWETSHLGSQRTFDGKCMYRRQGRNCEGPSGRSVTESGLRYRAPSETVQET